MTNVVPFRLASPRPQWRTLACEACNSYVPGDPESTLAHLIACEAGDTNLDRDATIRRICEALKRRSGKAWSVKGGRGTAWGWIEIASPPRRLGLNGVMTPEECAELGKLLGKDGPVHCQGESIPSGGDYYPEYVARAEGREPTVHGKPYWD